MHRLRVRKSYLGGLVLLLTLLMGVSAALAEVSVVLGYETRNQGEIEECG